MSCHPLSLLVDNKEKTGQSTKFAQKSPLESHHKSWFVIKVTINLFLQTLWQHCMTADDKRTATAELTTAPPSGGCPRPVPGVWPHWCPVSHTCPACCPHLSRPTQSQHVYSITWTCAFVLLKTQKRFILSPFSNYFLQLLKIITPKIIVKNYCKKG